MNKSTIHPETKLLTLLALKQNKTKIVVQTFISYIYSKISGIYTKLDILFTCYIKLAITSMYILICYH